MSDEDNGNGDPFASFYKLTPEFLARMRRELPMRAPEIDELMVLVPFIRRMADESNTRELTSAERTELMSSAIRMNELAQLLINYPTKQ